MLSSSPIKKEIDMKELVSLKAMDGALMKFDANAGIYEKVLEKKMKMLKRHLSTEHEMSPDEYRKRWDLGPDYPLVAPAYAETRRDLAKKIGLGRKPGQRRGRKKKAG